MSPRTKEQSEQLRIMRTQQIIAAAEQAFLEQGTNLDIRDVAKKADLGYGTVYHYYNNKHALLHDVMIKGLQLAEEATRHIFSTPDHPLVQVERYCHDMPLHWAKHPASFAVFKVASENFVGVDEDWTEEVRFRFQQNLYNPVADCLQRAITAKQVSPRHDAEQTANAIIGAMIGCYGIYFYHGTFTVDPSFITNALLLGIREERA
ncbi:MAG: TetR/AcrR family transcriptional regulator [Clostridia bacterium]